MRADALARLELDDRPRPLAEVFGHELAELHLPEETDTLRVLAPRVGKTRRRRDFREAAISADRPRGTIIATAGAATDARGNKSGPCARRLT